MALLASSALVAPALAADVTPDRLLNADKEPQNWLMNHAPMTASDFRPSPGSTRTTSRASSSPMRFRLAARRATNGSSDAARRERLPLHHGFVGRALQDRRDLGRRWPDRLAHGPQAGETGHQSRCGVLGNLVISPANWPARLIATDKDSGKVVWETNMMFGQPQLRITAAPLPIKDRIIVGASGGDSGRARLDRGPRRRDRQSTMAQIHDSRAGRARQRDLEGANNAWQTGGAAVWVTGTYDPDTNQTIWGTGNPVPMFDPTYRPGDNLYTNSAISWDPETGKMNWYFQFTPGDMWDYDEVEPTS